MIFENNQDKNTDETKKEVAHTYGVAPVKVFLMLALAIVGTAAFFNADKAIAVFTHAPTTSEILKTFPKDQVANREKWLTLKNQGEQELAELWRKDKNIAMTAIESVDQAPKPTQEAPAGNVQSQS